MKYDSMQRRAIEQAKFKQYQQVRVIKGLQEGAVGRIAEILPDDSTPPKIYFRIYGNDAPAHWLYLETELVSVLERPAQVVPLPGAADKPIIQAKKPGRRPKSVASFKMAYAKSTQQFIEAFCEKRDIDQMAFDLVLLERKLKRRLEERTFS